MARRAASPTKKKRRVSGPAVRRFPVVGLGASAGGLEAFEKFFSRMPADSGMAIVVVPHLDAQHKSAMTQLIQRFTAMKVCEIRTGMKVAPNRVYVIPPNGTLTLRQGRFRVVTPRQPLLTIDTFFKSLAVDQQDYAIGIVLSGTGSDGTLGVKALKEHGGLVLAQAPATSRYDSMPQNAVATGMVDGVLPVEDMPARLGEYAANIGRVRAHVNRPARDLRQPLAKIYAILRTSTGHDFSHYKNSTFMRRVQRRMQVLQLSSLGDYVNALRKDPREAELLFRDLLIGVTQFFRDAATFTLLEREVLPKIIGGKREDEALRLWVPGCATGEEAYSIAILVMEQLTRAKKSLKVQIFATDIDEEALAVARSGLYGANIARDIAPNRLERYFLRSDHRYRIVKDVRDMCIFSGQNLIHDAPFSRLDLISCRNLLIYLDASLQGRVIPLFHFALRNGGYLVLGPSENVTQHAKLFTKIDPRLRVFKARPMAPDRRVIELPLHGVTPPGPHSADRRGATVEGDESLGRRAMRVMEPYSPAYVVIDENADVLHFHGRTGRYLQPSPGAATLNLLQIIDTSLRPPVRDALKAVISGRRKQVEQNVIFETDGSSQQLNLVVRTIPTSDGQQRCFVVGFQDFGKAKTRAAAMRKSGRDAVRDETIDHLEAELRAAREKLQATVEELETSNEEMKASNEEFQSVNEELQSSNEELETSKEELQSINEELETVNTELNSKLEILERALNDRKNLLESTQLALVFLDSKLRIRNFTPAITDIFHLIESDNGRFIGDIVMKIRYTTLERDVRQVMRTLEKIEREFSVEEDDRFYLMRMVPYRTVENVIDGVVLTFIDISERNRNEQEFARIASIVSTSYDAIIGITPSAVVTTWNAGAERMYGYTPDQAIGQSLGCIVPPDRPNELQDVVTVVGGAGRVIRLDTERVTSKGGRVPVASVTSPIRDHSGRIVAASIIDRDITEQLRADERQKMLLAELNHRVKNILAGVLSIASRTAKDRDTIAEFRAAFEGRIRALAKTHDLLAAMSWEGAQLRDIVTMETKPYAEPGQRLQLNGGDLFLKSGAAVVLGMVFHELSTNAAKYGAFRRDGRVDIRWRKADSCLLLHWAEHGAPPPAKEVRRGFGLEFIERGVTHELQGSAKIGFHAGRMRCRIRIPLEEVEAPSFLVRQLAARVE